MSTRGKLMGPNKMVLICVGLPEHMSTRILSAGVTYFRREITIDCRAELTREIFLFIIGLIT